MGRHKEPEKTADPLTQGFAALSAKRIDLKAMMAAKGIVPGVRR